MKANGLIAGSNGVCMHMGSEGGEDVVFDINVCAGNEAYLELVWASTAESTWRA